jgi:hypothetical protein
MVRSFGVVLYGPERANDAGLRQRLEDRYPSLRGSHYVLEVLGVERRGPGHARFHVSVQLEGPDAAGIEKKYAVELAPRTISLPLRLRPALKLAELEMLVPAALAEACPDLYWRAQGLEFIHDGRTLEITVLWPVGLEFDVHGELELVRLLREGARHLRDSGEGDR